MKTSQAIKLTSRKSPYPILKTSKGGEAPLKYFELCLEMNTGTGFVQQNSFYGFRNGPMNESQCNGSMENTFYQLVRCNNFFKTVSRVKAM